MVLGDHKILPKVNNEVSKGSVYKQWNGILEWTTGLTYVWVLHIFGWLIIN